MLLQVDMLKLELKLTLPLMMPRLRERRAAASAVAGLGPSLTPSGPFGLDSLPPMLEVLRAIG